MEIEHAQHEFGLIGVRICLHTSGPYLTSLALGKMSGITSDRAVISGQVWLSFNPRLSCLTWLLVLSKTCAVMQKVYVKGKSNFSAHQH